MEKKPIRACAIGVDQVLNVWRSMNDGYPYFAIFYGIKSSKFFQYNRDNLQGAEEFLQTNLNPIADTGDNSLYYLSIYPESKVNYTGSGEICCFPFRLNPYEESVQGQVGGYAGGGDAFARMLQAANDKQIELVKEIAELKAANQPLDWFDKISGVLETPGAANTLVPLFQPVIAGLMGILGKISGVPVGMPMQYNGIGQVPSIAGPASSPDELNQVVDAALDRLEKHGNLAEMLTVLADFADKNPVMFKMYFDGLKAQAQ
jgi:hypothetical protein